MNDFKDCWGNGKDPFSMLPTFQTVDAPCPHCGGMHRIMVRPEAMSWQDTADSYRKALNDMYESHRKILDDLDVMYGDANPVTVYYRNRMREMVDRIKRMLMDGK